MALFQNQKKHLVFLEVHVLLLHFNNDSSCSVTVIEIFGCGPNRITRVFLCANVIFYCFHSILVFLALKKNRESPATTSEKLYDKVTRDWKNVSRGLLAQGSV